VISETKFFAVVFQGNSRRACFGESAALFQHRSVPRAFLARAHATLAQ